MARHSNLASKAALENDNDEDADDDEFFGVLLQVVYQNWQISGLEKEEEVNDVN